MTASRVTRLLIGLGTVLICLIAGSAAAQPAALSPFDITGNWTPAGGGPTFLGGGGFQEDAPERQDGPALVDYLGIPLNAAGRARALSYDSSLLSVPEHQCMPHPGMYSFWGPPDSAAGANIAADLDDSLAVVRYRVGGMFRRADRVIWMDGRPHPPAYAAHTWAGFTTGRWNGNVLETETTHLKWGWIRRNGVIASDQTKVITRYARHGNVLTITVIVEDPLYLSEPYIKTIDFIPLGRLPTARFNVDPRDGRGGIFTQCYPNEEVVRANRDIPHYLPWENPFMTEEERRQMLPAGAVLGGAETALPEFTAPGARRGGPPTVPAPQPLPPQAPISGVQVVRVQGNVWMVVTPNGNLAVQVGEEGVVLVDTGAAGDADAILAAIRTITDKPIRYIINTSAAPERVGSNGVIATLPGGATTKPGQGPTPAVIAHEKVLTRMTGDDGGRAAYPAGGWPTDAFLLSKRTLYFNGEVIEVIHQPAAYSDGDSIVHFRKSDVIVAGRLLTTTHFPRFDPSRGGTYQGVLNSLNAMLDITVPRFMQEEGTYIVPGQGRIADEADLTEIRDQAQMIRDRFMDLAVKKRLPIDRARAMNPLIDLEQRYDRPDWTTEQFSAAVYAEVTRVSSLAAQPQGPQRGTPRRVR
jgi:cyclase